MIDAGFSRARGKGVGVDMAILHNYEFFARTFLNSKFANLKNLFNNFDKQILHF